MGLVLPCFLARGDCVDGEYMSAPCPCDLDVLSDAVARKKLREISSLRARVIKECFRSSFFSVCGLQLLHETLPLKNHWQIDQPEWELLSKLHCEWFRDLPQETVSELQCVVGCLIDRAFAEAKAKEQPKAETVAVPTKPKWWQVWK